VPQDKFMQHLCRKGMTTQNVLACCDFDMRFTFVLAGWPGSAHDMRVFRDATTRYGHVFPHPPTGLYLLLVHSVDKGGSSSRYSCAVAMVQGNITWWTRAMLTDLVT